MTTDGTAMSKFGLLVLAIVAFQTSAFAQQGDASSGRQAFRVCAACHSLEPDRNMTGPSLAGLWGRKAGGLANFERYSEALKSSGIIWDDHSLDGWLTDPDRMVPDNEMPFNGIKDARIRADLLAFLKDATQPGRAPKTAQGGNQVGGMMMGGGAVPNLKTLDPQERVRSINHCGDTYKVTTADRKTRDFWERNLRFKTDVSDDGPQKGALALVGAGMMGDRADVIFASPEEISGFIAQKC